MVEPSPLEQANALKDEVADFRAEVTRRNWLITGLLLVAMLLFAFTAYNTYSGLQASSAARAASESNGDVLKLIQSVLNPNSEIRKEGLCSQLILHGLDGPECAAVRQGMVEAGARIP